ncbi:MAG TPA: hypothetical protein VFN67_32215 [Polyangiales bacterium]|nr:hypothetical protein [Polyangiales bacterium]
MRSAGCERVFCWFSALCVCGLVVLAPLTAASAQEPAAAAAAAESGGAPAAIPETAVDSRIEAAIDGTGPTEAIATASSDEAKVEEQEEEEAPSEEEIAARERTEPNLSLSVQLGAGYMSGGHGGLFSANRSPLGIDVQVLTVREPRYLLGGALRLELEGAHAVAAIVRFQLRHPMGPIELRPGIGVPFYIAPRTMLGPEAGLWGRLSFSQDLALLVAFSAAAFVMGDDVPKGNTVIMLQIFVGVELFI